MSLVHHDTAHTAEALVPKRALPVLALLFSATAWPATGRFGNVARTVSSPNHIGRVFLGRGMVVPAIPRDFFGLTATQLATDTDGDFTPDVFDPDNDNDGLSDVAEIGTHRSDACKPDTDDDGAGDGWEVTHGFDPLDATDGDSDADGDGFSNRHESLNGTDPHRYVVKLKAGWNCISIAGVPRDNSVRAILGRQHTGPVWAWVDGAFQRVNELLPYRGHWVFVREASDVEIVLP